MPRIKIGDICSMGHYGGETITWRVLDIQYGKALLISEYGLDAQPYHNTWEEVTWDKCNLRKWLNCYFKNNAFSTDEINKIIDEIFLLSIREAEQYFRNNEDRKCMPTDYAKERGAYIFNDISHVSKAISWWWLRSSLNQGGAGVDIDGCVLDIISSVDDDNGCVRPALWICL